MIRNVHFLPPFNRLTQTKTCHSILSFFFLVFFFCIKFS